MDEIRWKKATAGTPRAETPKNRKDACNTRNATDARPERIEKQVSEETSTEALATAENRRAKQRKLQQQQGRQPHKTVMVNRGCQQQQDCQKAMEMEC
jgi:hypothetical protein